jgi:1,4-dihydroxy-2-naphthoate octaprenyltransferase
LKRFSGWVVAWIGLLALVYAIYFFTRNPQPWGYVLGAGVITAVVMMQGLRIVDRNPRKVKLTK